MATRLHLAMWGLSRDAIESVLRPVNYKVGWKHQVGSARDDSDRANPTGRAFIAVLRHARLEHGVSAQPRRGPDWNQVPGPSGTQIERV
jgi:hypothetical protein